MAEWSGVVALLSVFALLMLLAMWVGARRARLFDRALAELGFVRAAAGPHDASIFERPGAAVSAVLCGYIEGAPLTLVFGSCEGRVLAWEGVFDVQRISLLAALVRPADPQHWLDTWTAPGAERLGWRPAAAGRCLQDGTAVLIWEGCGQHGPTLSRVCSALARTPGLVGPKRVELRVVAK